MTRLEVNMEGSESMAREVSNEVRKLTQLDSSEFLIQVSTAEPADSNYHLLNVLVSFLFLL